MIRSYSLQDPSGVHLRWVREKKVRGLIAPREFMFTPGLNIVFGKNGSGKSTLIRLMSDVLHCTQGGFTCVTDHSLRELGVHENTQSLQKFRDSWRLDHDGQCVQYFNPKEAVGLYHGAAFDEDFLLRGVSESIFKGSSGQTTKFRIDSLFSSVLGESVPEKKWKTYKRREPPDAQDEFNMTQYRAQQFIEETLTGSGELGHRTVLLDEPDTNMDIESQVMLWRFLRYAGQTVQVIVASHSLYALQIKEANYIEVDPTDVYIDKCLRCLAILRDWSSEGIIQIPRKKK